MRGWMSPGLQRQRLPIVVTWTGSDNGWWSAAPAECALPTWASEQPHRANRRWPDHRNGRERSKARSSRPPSAAGTPPSGWCTRSWAWVPIPAARPACADEGRGRRINGRPQPACLGSDRPTSASGGTVLTPPARGLCHTTPGSGADRPHAAGLPAEHRGGRRGAAWYAPRPWVRLDSAPPSAVKWLRAGAAGRRRWRARRRQHHAAWTATSSPAWSARCKRRTRQQAAG